MQQPLSQPKRNVVESGVIEDALRRDTPRVAALTIAQFVITHAAECKPCVEESCCLAKVIMGAAYAFGVANLGGVAKDHIPVNDVSDLVSTSVFTDVLEFEESRFHMDSCLFEDSILESEFSVQWLVFHYLVSTVGERAAVNYWLDPGSDELLEFRD